ncbi:hypothetical protein NE237_000446 [Protea cynaroides]|uniref:Uncharacterized protein n=1 Tax=Protea cynaroides TaxID=273540 RepID=A0A9Q0QX54_9MAGN|nr:hypothetical protein NE237_000446 [Protea cynaroides]
MHDYLPKVKTISNQLVASSHLVVDEDLCLHVLNGLGPEYAAFVTSISTHGILMTYKDLRGMFLTQEICLMAENPFVDIQNSSAYYTTSNDLRGGSGNHSQSANRGRYNQGRNAPSHFYHTATPLGSYSCNGSHSRYSSSNAPDYCQICNQIGHKALDYHQ